MTEPKLKIKDSVAWLSLLARLLGLLERLLPAFLVAWNAELGRRNAVLYARLQNAKLREQIRGKKDQVLEENGGKSDREVVDSLLSGGYPQPGDKRGTGL